MNGFKVFHIANSTAFFLALLFFYAPVTAQALQITSPTSPATVTDDTTTFLFQTDDGANRWAIFEPTAGARFCGDTINGYGAGVTWSMTDFETACGTSATLGDGDYHILLVDTTNSACGAGNDYATCIASGEYLGEDVLVTVGTPPPPPPPAGVSTSSIITASSTPHTTADTDFMLSIFLILAFYFFIDDIYYKLFKPHHA